MEISEEIAKGFEALNIRVGVNVLTRCEELCVQYKIDPEDFIDLWLAYTASNLNGEPPSLEALDKMERKELQKQNNNIIVKTPKTVRSKQADSELHPVKQHVQKELLPQPDSVINDLVEPMTQDTPSQLFSQRTDSRSVLCQFGDFHPNTFKERANGMLIITIQNEEIVGSRYMYEKFLSKQQAINSITKWIAGSVLDYYKLELSQEKLKDYFGEMVICGRIYPETPGKLNLQSLIIEGVLEFYRGQTMKLVVDSADKVALFSGQVVVIKGINMRNYFVAKQIHSGAPLSLPEKLVTLEEPLQIVVAAGPFTMPDNLLYEPLEDLLKYVVEFKPNMLILLGPFVEATHSVLENTNECYDSFFESIVDGIMERLKDTDTKVILIPSHKDVHNHVIFPSLPFKLQKQHDNLICAPNPFILEVDGLLVGGSSADVLFHIGKSEVFKDQSGSADKMSRLITHLFNQRSFYPLHPPDSDIRVDYQSLEKHAMLENLPHIMILPSNFRYFVKKVDGCVVINPERLVKGQIAGTFARVEVRPGEGVVCDRISCQILRV